MGNVKIELHENFDVENANLLPGKENAVQKEVWIKNVGTENAYVWYEWWIPSVLDSTDGSTGTNNILHVNSYGRTWDRFRENPAYWAPGQTEPLPLEQTWDHDPENELGLALGPEGFFRQETVDGVLYNVYVVLYHGELAAGEETTIAMCQAYLDKKLDNLYDADGNVYYVIDGVTVDFDFSEGIHIFVKAFGIQSKLADKDGDGDVDVYDAYKTYNNLP
jgi:hypothetical protein